MQRMTHENKEEMVQIINKNLYLPVIKEAK
jgi:hypothetical protein